MDRVAHLLFQGHALRATVETLTPFSASIAHTLLSQSPAHAMAQILAPDEPTEVMEIGTVAHQVLLEHDTSRVAVIDAADWRKQATRDTRDAARAAGQTPILAAKWARVEKMVEAAREQFEAFTPVPFARESGLAEHSLVVTLDGVPCRATPDWLTLDNRHCWDLKTTGVTANPAAFSRTLWDKGYQLQFALYRRVVRALTGVLPEFEFVVVETEPPFAVSVVGLDPEASVFADAQLDHALAIWKRCNETGRWPGYPTRVCYAEPPAWLIAQFQAAEYYR